jgi:hypothetical protein
MTAAILSMLPSSRGRKAYGDLPQVLRFYPTRRTGQSFVYAIAFKGGVVKVGKTANPRGRLHDHWKRGKGEVTWIHLFAPMTADVAWHAERRAVSDLRSIARQINGSEWFFSEDKAALIAVIRRAITEGRAIAAWRAGKEAAEKRRVVAAVEALNAAGIKATAETNGLGPYINLVRAA